MPEQTQLLSMILLTVKIQSPDFT